MRRRFLRYAAFASLVLVPTATALPPTIGVSISGTSGANGWYRSSVTVTFSIPAGSTPGGNCFQVGNNSFPVSQQGSTTLTCTATNADGSDQKSVVVRIDSVAPSVTGGSPSRGPDQNGWYNHAVTLTGSGSDATSGLAGCSGQTYSGPDSASASAQLVCSDVAGNTASGPSNTFKYDGTPPSIGASVARGPDSNGWYTRPVEVSFSGGDATSGLAGCSSGTTYSGPDGAGSPSGTCTDVAGNTASTSVSLNYDGTAPSVVEARTDRPPDVGDWFNHPVNVAFTGQDSGSGVAGCTTVTYSGPDNRDVTIEGSCTDRAGHTSQAKAFKLKYDATPPTLSDVVAQVGNRFALLKWKISADVANIRVTRTPGRAGEAQTIVYNGRADFFKDTGIDNRAKYEYRVIAADEAANATPEAIATAVPLPPLYNPVGGARVRAPIVFEWLAIPRATYYNLQVWCRGRKILTAWPKRPRLVVPARGTFAGRSYVLPFGSCRWYVWPGRGRFIEKRYGRLAGSSTFIRRR